MADETRDADTSEDDISMFLQPTEGQEKPDEDEGDTETEDAAKAEEPETEEAEAEDGDEEEEQPDEDSDEEEDDDDPLVSIETKRGNIDVPFSELKKGYLRQQDYTRKTQEASELRRQAEEHQQTLAQKQQELEAALTEWAVQEQPEPNWAELAQQLDPYQYNLARAQWDQNQRQIQQAKQYRQQLLQETQRETVEAERDKLLEAVPEWSDPDTFNREAADILGYAESYGFSREEVEAATDHRILMLLRDAARFQKRSAGNAAAEKKVTKAAKSLPPGARTTKQERRQKLQRQKLDRVKRDGDEESFADWLLMGS